MWEAHRLCFTKNLNGAITPNEGVGEATLRTLLAGNKMDAQQRCTDAATRKLQGHNLWPLPKLYMVVIFIRMWLQEGWLDVQSALRVAINFTKVSTYQAVHFVMDHISSSVRSQLSAFGLA